MVSRRGNGSPWGGFAGIARPFLLLTFMTLNAAHLRADPALPHLFSDHMVLQRSVKYSVWGWADAGEAIAVALGGSMRKTVAGSDHRWKVTLPAMAAGGPFTLIVQGKKRRVVKDVMFGEVWVASGQSNMTFALRGATGAEEEISKAVYPQIRFFTVPNRIALAPQEDTLPATWETCTPKTAKEFSAVGYFFARDLEKALHVPVGIILSAWPGTAGEEWTDPESLRREPLLQPIVQRWEAEPDDVKALAVSPEKVSLRFDDFELVRAPGDTRDPLLLSNFDDGTSRVATGGSWTYDWVDAPDSVFELAAPGRGGTGYAAHIAGELSGSVYSHWLASFHEDESPADLTEYAGIRFWVRGTGSYVVHVLEPSIFDADDYSAPREQATPEWKQVTIWLKDLKQAGWGVTAPLTTGGLTGIEITGMPRAGDPDRPPSGLYEGMIAPLFAYRIRGAIWYQGEGNTWRAYQYRKLLPALIEGWRKGWAEPGFPFLIVQLPNHGTSPELGDSIWAELREAQMLTAKNVPNTGLAVTIDVGDPKNLHPPRKAEIGERLARWALGTTYQQNVTYSGPWYESMQIAGNEIRIRFEHAGSGLEARGGPLKGFAIAGGDRTFHWASAQIRGNEVVVSSPEVDSPVAVRYGWAGSPECNLYNKEGLPASPFRTDDWPGATMEKN